MVKELGKQDSLSVKSSPERKRTYSPDTEKKVKVVRSCSGTNIGRERSPCRTIECSSSPDRDRVTKVIVYKSPSKRSPRGSIDRSKSPNNKSPRNSIDKTRSPQHSVDRSRSPHSSMSKSRENSVDRSRSPKPAPKKGIIRTPQASFDRSPNKSPNVSRRSSKSSGDKLAKLGTNSLDRMTHYSALERCEDKAMKMGIVVSKSTESIAKTIEHPTCVQCYLSMKSLAKPS